MLQFKGKIVSPKPILRYEIFLKAGVHLFPHADDKEGVATVNTSIVYNISNNYTQHRPRMKYSECFSIFDELFLKFSKGNH